MRRRRAAVLGAALAVGLGACAGSPWPDGLRDVDHPELEAIEDVARRQIEAERDRLEELLGRGRGELSELAAAFGGMGRLYHAYRLHDAAAACYANAQALDPESFLWPYYRGLLDQASGSFEEARGHFERALELGPGNGPARLRLGEVLLALNDPEGARACFEPLAGDERYAAAALAGLGKAAASGGDTERAVEHFEAALAIEPEAAGVHHALGMALRRLGRLEEARGHLGRGGAAEIAFADPLEEQLEELAVTSGSYLRRGNQALFAGRLDEAVAAFRRAVEADPGSVAARRNLALALARKGEAGAAADELEEALERAPEDARLLFDLGNARRAAGDAERAVAAYGAALERDPGFVDARFNLANVLAETGRWSEAAGHLGTVLELEADHGRARYLEAMALHHLGRSGEAISKLTALREADPGSVVARQGLATIYSAQGQPGRAFAVYREALALDLPAKETIELLNLAAPLAWRQGRRDEAVALYRRAAELQPGSSPALTRLANALQLAGEREEAAELFARATELDPGNATAWLSEASLLILAGRYGRAVSRLGEALERSPGHVGLVHTLARLLATCPDGAHRDGTRALTLAERAYQSERTLEHAATVAMALAELGRFEEAIQWQRSLVRQSASGPAALKRRLAEHLALFERRRPVRIGGA